MPASATRTEKSISPSSEAARDSSGSAGCSTLAATATGAGARPAARSGATSVVICTACAVKLGSRKCSIVFDPPSAAGMPTKPATIGADRQRHQRKRHRRRRLVRPVPRTVAMSGGVRIGGAVREVVILLVPVTMRRRVRRVRRAVLRRQVRILRVINRRDADSVAGGFPRRTPIGAKEGHRHQAPHVERRHHCRNDRQHPHGFVVHVGAGTGFRPC